MPRYKETLDAQSIRPSDEITLGLMESIIPKQLISQVLLKHDRQSKRQRLLPNDFVVYLIIAAYLYMGVSQSEVLRLLLERLIVLFHHPVRVADKSAISKARQRIGLEPLQEVFYETVGPLAKQATKGAFYKGCRLCAIDGSTLDMADSKKNRREFGKTHLGERDAPYPQMRIAALCEVGTRVIFDASYGKLSDSELTIAQRLLKSLTPEMLLIGDRLYGNFPFAFLVKQQDASFVLRVRSNMKLPVLQTLSDGSALVKWRYKKDPRCKSNDVADKSEITIRLIHYQLVDKQGKLTVVRLITDLLDEKRYPAKEIAHLYTERWNVETAFDEIKSRLKGSRNLLRSGLPELVVQDFFGLLLAHFIIRKTMHDAAMKNNVDPRRLSFTHARNTLKRRLIMLAISP